MPVPPDRSTSPAERMSAYLDAELDPAEAEAFEQFIATTPAAKQELDDLRRVVSLVATLPQVSVSPGFYDRLCRRIRRRRAFANPAGRLSWGSLPFHVLSIVVIVSIAAMYMMAQLDQAPHAIDRDTAPTDAGPEPPSEP